MPPYMRRPTSAVWAKGPGPTGGVPHSLHVVMHGQCDVKPIGLQLHSQSQSNIAFWPVMMPLALVVLKDKLWSCPWRSSLSVVSNWWLWFLLNYASSHFSATFMLTAATSAAVERVFSQKGVCFRPHRARMSNSLLQTLVFRSV